MAERVLWSADGLNLTIGKQIIFSDAQFSIAENERVALVGRNGSGKSTLLKIIAGTESASAGTVMSARNIRISLMPQDCSAFADLSAHDLVRSGLHYFQSIHELCDKVPPSSPEHERLEHILTMNDAWDIELKLDIMLDKLSLSDMNKKAKELSGGELRRTLLAASIIGAPDLLLLDEPTNHLDVATVAWIEDFLADYRGACLFVTHDRYFLDRLASRIVELDHGKFYSCEGSYADFLAAKEDREYSEDVEEAKRKSFLRREIEWVRRSPKARLRRNLGRLKHYDDIAAIQAPERTGDMELVIPKASHLGNQVVNLKNVSFSRGNRKLIDDFSFEFEPGCKVGIVGANGTGKTTLLKLITGQLAPDSGEIYAAPTVEFNYIDQDRVQLDPEKTVCEEIGAGFSTVNLGEERISIWGYLKRFMFEDDRINTQIKLLSGGEKARIALAKILKGGGNFLILDEPTNDLDLPTLRILEEALAAYRGCLTVVSHDRYFLNRVCTRLLAFEESGKIVSNLGDYDYYLECKSRRKESESSKVEKKTPEPAVQKEKKTVLKLSFKENRELESLETEIPELEEKIAELERTFADPDFFAKHGKEIPELQENLQKSKTLLDGKYKRWEELEAKKESFQKK